MNLRHRGPTARHRARCQLAWQLFDAYIEHAETTRSERATGADEHAELTGEAADFYYRLVQLFGPEPLATR